jgi:hypothetical protein
MSRFAPAHVALAAYSGGLCLSLVALPWPVALLVAILPSVAVAVCAPLVERRSPARERAARGLSESHVSVHGLPVPEASPDWSDEAPVRGWLPLARLAFLAALLAVAGLVVGSGRLTVVRHTALGTLLYESVPARVTVLDLPRADDRAVQVTVQVTQVAGRHLSERAELELKREDGDALPLSALVEGTVLDIAQARVEPLPEPKRGAFDYARYLERRGGGRGGAPPRRSPRRASSGAAGARTASSTACAWRLANGSTPGSRRP